MFHTVHLYYPPFTAVFMLSLPDGFVYVFVWSGHYMPMCRVTDRGIGNLPVTYRLTLCHTRLTVIHNNYNNSLSIDVDVAMQVPVKHF